MENKDLSPKLEDLATELGEVSGGLFVTEAAYALELLKSPFTTGPNAVEAAQLAARAVAVYKAGLGDSQTFRAAYDANKPKNFTALPPIPLEMELQNAMGAKLLNLVTDKAGTEVHFTIGYHAGLIADYMLRDLWKRGIPFHIDAPDTDFSRLLISHADETGLKAYADYRLNLFKDVTHRITAMPNSMPPSAVQGDAEKSKLFDTFMRPYSKKTGSGEVVFTLTYFPTEIDAELDGIPLDDYLQLHFEMSDQPDHLIVKAHEVLIERLNRTKHVRFTNDDGTDISMELTDENGRQFTFCNSMAYRNVPGSEVFSAPRRDSLNGTIVAKGKFNPKSDKSSVIENLTLEFKDGKIVSFTADKGANVFQAFLDRDPNNSYVGELGIGTNPHLKRHVLNGLLVEKIGGSFHLALGAAYTMTDYLGTPVHVDNGNRSVDHWDVTTMLYGCGGRMYLDDEMVMDNGIFLDPALDVLNRGWLAVPAEDRPDRWKDYKGPFTGI
ncbi:MAG: leucyl aminopeptidase [Micavibrio aeruginosavorus]|uniref:Leucyl aminopeptidase n=1 Tax=Micavibrio aeruginosavorus TaxID=349221 RepID=A0A2W5A5A9_9BACT|nr:MAG: leucyl aminopeptidase [Micavibrio aeruginosavorus]